MKNENDLRGLDLNGFMNSTENFDSSVFANNQTIELLRPEIKKYFSKTNSNNRNYNSYGIKHIAEKHLGTYVSNGELIYAMHLEGYQIFRKNINCTFNVSEPSVRYMRNAKSILKTLTSSMPSEIIDYLNLKKRPSKYKYHLRLLINLNFGNNFIRKKDVIAIISKEINVTPQTFQSWIQILATDSNEIPLDKLKLLSEIFNQPINKLISY